MAIDRSRWEPSPCATIPPCIVTGDTTGYVPLCLASVHRHWRHNKVCDRLWVLTLLPLLQVAVRMRPGVTFSGVHPEYVTPAAVSDVSIGSIPLVPVRAHLFLLRRPLLRTTA